MTAAESLSLEEIERLVLEAAQEVLGGEVVRADQSFFDQGGDSLSAMRLLGRLRLTTGFPLRIRVLFDTPDLSAVAQEIFSAQASDRAPR
jgi:acyl carrier protein